MTDPYGRNFQGTPPEKRKLFSPFRVFRYFLYLPLLFLRWYADWSNFGHNEVASVVRILLTLLGVVWPMVALVTGSWITVGVTVGVVFAIGFLYAGFHLDDDARWQALKDRLLK